MKEYLIKNINKIGILLFLVFMFSYGIIESKPMIEGPKVTIKSPIYGETYKNQDLIIKGIAKNIKTISLNGRDIFLDKEGNFIEKLLMSPGYNIISIKAEDRFGKQISKKIEITCLCDNQN